MTVKEQKLPVPVMAHPHWRVNYRPAHYQPNLIPTLKDCLRIVEETKVSLRGWDFPHLSRRPNQRSFGTNWVASWSDFMGHLEYWRLYQSAQFLYLSSVREATEEAFRAKLEIETRSHLKSLPNIKWDEVKGLISIVNFIYTMTEIFEFASRLCERGIYQGKVRVAVALRGMKGFVLTTDQSRVWHSLYAATEEQLANEWQTDSDALISTSADLALTAVSWFFERFGWIDQPVSVFRGDQENLLKRRL